MRNLARKKMAVILAAAILCISFAGCSRNPNWVPLRAPKGNVSSENQIKQKNSEKEKIKENPSKTSKTSSTSSKASSKESEKQQSAPALKDSSMRGRGNIGLLEKIGNKDGGFALSGTPWYSKRENFIKGLMGTWPGLAKAEIATDYNKDGSSIYHFEAAVEFKDFPKAAEISWTEQKGQVTSASYIFRFSKDKKEEYRTAFLQARDMMTEALGKPDEEMAPFDDSLPGGATWKAADGSGIGISDSSIPNKNLQFSITLSAGQAVG